jgi:predicted Zn-dependent protease
MKRAAVSLVLVVAIFGADSTGLAQISLVSVREEIDIGRRANAQVRRQVAEVRDAEVTSYLRSIGQRLARAARGPAYPYSFAMANDREINAFALPGGPVWINRGVLHAATNESQVAGVLAHEVAHISERHAAEQLTKATVANLGLGLLGALLGNGGGAGAAQMAATFATDGLFLKFSRDAEREADQVGLQILRRGGWDARGMVELFELLQREARRNPNSVDAFFSSHPSPQDRISRLRAQTGPGGTRDSQRFRAVKAKLQRMRAPRASN